MLMEKANQFASELGVEFTANTGWLQRFKGRNGIAQRVVSGESAAVQQDTVADWRSTILQELLQEYQAKDIYNEDETGLFYRCLPDKTLAYKTESVHGHKQPKDRLTVLIATNMDGTDKLTLLVIGKAKKPHCFRGVANLPCEYTFNKKAWMLSGIFEEWVRKLDRKMVCGGRKIVLLVDNCPAHPIVEGLQAIKLVFLPPNTASVLQPCDQGIIQAFKRLYRKSVLRQYLAHLDSGGTAGDMRITVIDALFTMRSVWRDVSQSTISNCWRHAGFAFTPAGDVSEQPELPDADNLFERLASLLPTTQLCTPEEYIQVDEEAQTSAALTDQEIVEQVKAAGSVPPPCDEEEEEPEEQLKAVSSSEVQKCLQTVRDVFLLNGGGVFFDSLGEMEKHILHVGEKGKKQMNITSFFVPLAKK